MGLDKEKIAREIIQEDIGKYVVFSTKGNIASMPNFNASHIMEAMFKFYDKMLESQNASTSDEALHIADVGGCTDLDIEDAASDCVEYYEKQSGENLTAREKACFIDGYNVGGKAVRNRLTKKY